jgi:peptide/nickel transport system substrate-binding protein
LFESLQRFIPVLYLLLLIIVSACSSPPDNTLRFGLASAPVTLDPRFATDATSERINRLLYQRLVDFDETMMPAPELADWQKLSPIHYRFTLRDSNNHFHDGTSLTAKDVKATYDFVLDPKNASPLRAPLSVVDHISAPDARNIDFYLNKPDALFPGYAVLNILPAALIAEKHPFQRQPVGSGPFAFVAWPEEGRLQLRRVSDGQRLEFVRVTDTTVRVLKLLRGEIDMLQNDLPPELVNYLRHQKNAQDKGLQISEGRGSNFTYLGFNLQDAVAGRHEVRLAIAHAIDRDAIINHVFGGAARKASALLPPDHWAGNPTLPQYAYDPDQSRRLLAALGYSVEHPLTISYKTSSDPFRLRIATVIQSQLAAVGIKMVLHSYDWGTFYADIKAGNFQMYSLSWVGIHTPDIFRYVFYSQSTPPQGANRGRFADAQVDALIEQAQQASDLARQAQLYRQLQRRLFDTLPYVPLWYEDHIFIARPGVSGYRVNLDGNYDGLITTFLSRQ